MLYVDYIEASLQTTNACLLLECICAPLSRSLARSLSFARARAPPPPPPLSPAPSLSLSRVCFLDDLTSYWLSSRYVSSSFSQSIDYMGYRMRTPQYSMSVWARWNGTALQPDWTDVVEYELYDHTFVVSGLFSIEFNPLAPACLSQKRRWHGPGSV